MDAPGSWGQAEVLALRGPSAPVHWKGTPITPEVYSAPQLTISTVDLDVAFTLPSPQRHNTGLPPEAVLVSGQVPSMGGDFGSGGGSRSPYSGEGCWLATPEALYNFDPGLKSYLPPGTYRVVVRVGCAGGVGDEGEFELVSPRSWDGLSLTRLDAPPR